MKSFSFATGVEENIWNLLVNEKMHFKSTFHLPIPQLMALKYKYAKKFCNYINPISYFWFIPFVLLCTYLVEYLCKLGELTSSCTSMSHNLLASRQKVHDLPAFCCWVSFFVSTLQYTSRHKEWNNPGFMLHFVHL